MVPIYENYKDYQGPYYAKRTIAKLLSTLPKHYLSGLQSVVLTNSTAVGKGKTRRVKGKKFRRQDCLGYYHPKWNGAQPWIEIVVDNVVASGGTPRSVMHIPLVRNLAFAGTLFHEVGHHLDHTIGAPARSGEAAAEAWQNRLAASYFRKQYWYLVPLLRIVKALFGRAIRRRLADRNG